MNHRTPYPPRYGEDDPDRNKDHWLEEQDRKATHRDINLGMCRFPQGKVGVEVIDYLIGQGLLRRGV